jgi:hypothetical protein
MADATGLLPITVVITLTGQEPGNEHTSNPQRFKRGEKKGDTYMAVGNHTDEVIQRDVQVYQF